MSSARSQVLFCIVEGKETKKFSFPKHFHFEKTSPETFSLAFEKLKGHPAEVIWVVEEEYFLQLLDGLKKAGYALAKSGVVVVAKNSLDFFQKNSGFSEIVEVITSEEGQKALSLFLMRAERNWKLRTSQLPSEKLNQETLEKLNQILVELSALKNSQKLLMAILLKSMDLLNSDGGALSLVYEQEGEFSFKMRVKHKKSEEISIEPTTSRVGENSVLGYVALTGRLFNIHSIENMKPTSVPQLNKQLDFYAENEAHVLITVPLRNGRNEIIAVLQLYRKSKEVFTKEDESLITSFATQAAICLENLELYGDIQRLFEGFIKASITAIESRDPSTGGHSERVAKISVALAKATDEWDTGIYRSVRFKEEEIRELEYAALLHDFGKIGVREEVLIKAKKLYAHQLESIRERIKICKAAAKISYLEKRLNSKESKGNLEKQYEEELKKIDFYWNIIMAANEPSVLRKENKEELDKIKQAQLRLPDGSHIAVITEDEYQALCIKQGSLTESERLEIESHVRHTYQFLKMIPWTRDFRNLTEIAYCHHEKLDGTGYPRGLTSHEIPLQSKIMTIADIYDALTAADRWYKEAVPPQKALEILSFEVNKGQLDPVLFEIFVQRKIYEVTHGNLLGRVA